MAEVDNPEDDDYAEEYEDDETPEQEMTDQEFMREEIMMQEGYRCGHCAVHPCYKNTARDAPADPSCFQHTRTCRDECDFLKILEHVGYVCQMDHRPVLYNQRCQIPCLRRSRLPRKMSLDRLRF